jgi:glycosyltransferase involved in cell wall biosynthesis
MEEAWEGIQVFRSWLYASPTHGFLRTLLNNASFMATSGLQGLMRGKGLDVLIASSPPLFPHVSGAAVSLVRRLPLVLEVRDLWPDYLVDMGILKRNSLAARALFSVERALLRRADAVTVVTESFRQRMHEKGVAPDQVHLMPAGVDADFYFPSAERPSISALVRRDAEFIVGYLGNFGAGQSLGTVIEAAARLENRRPQVRFVLVGDGPQRDQMCREVSTRQLRNLSIHPPVPKSETRAFYANCDLCLVPLAPVPVFQETIPSKIFEILACCRPIVASVDGEARLITESSGGGWVTPPGEAGALADAILRAVSTPKEERARMGARGRAYVMKHYSRSAISARYLEVLQGVVARRR